jgi:hypothetical protein
MYINFFSNRRPSQITQIGIFGLKINHLATLMWSHHFFQNAAPNRGIFGSTCVESSIWHCFVTLLLFLCHVDGNLKLRVILVAPFNHPVNGCLITLVELKVNPADFILILENF